MSTTPATKVLGRRIVAAIVDAFPAVGLITILASDGNRRVGDMVSGT